MKVQLCISYFEVECYYKLVKELSLNPSSTVTMVRRSKTLPSSGCFYEHL